MTTNNICVGLGVLVSSCGVLDPLIIRPCRNEKRTWRHHSIRVVHVESRHVPDCKSISRVNVWEPDGPLRDHTISTFTQSDLWGFVKNVWSWYSRVRSLAALPRSRFVSWPAGILPRLKYKRHTVKTSADGFSRLERMKRWNAADLLLDRRYGAPQTSVSPAAHSHRSFLQPERRRTEF